MRIISIIILITLTTNSLLACFSASQNRIFPLGKTDNGLCVVESYLTRTEYSWEDKESFEMERAWIGFTYFKVYDSNFKEIHSELIDTLKLFRQKKYDSTLTSTFKKGLKIAKTYTGFIAAKPDSIYFCDYRIKCSKANLIFDTISNNVFLELPHNKKYDVKALYNSTSNASNVLEYFRAYNDGKYPTADSFNNRIYINSVRQFKIGDKKLTIIHIGCGQKAELLDEGTYPPGNEYEADFEFTNINNSIYLEPVLHHGHGFDFFIWE